MFLFRRRFGLAAKEDEDTAARLDDRVFKIKCHHVVLKTDQKVST